MGTGVGNPMVGLVRNGKCDRDFFLCCLLALDSDVVP